MSKERKITQKIISAAVFILLEIAAVAMLRNNGTLQKIWISRASHQLMAWTWGGSESIVDFFKLKRTNAELAEENARLLQELRKYHDMDNSSKEKAATDSLAYDSSSFHMIPATIVKISRNKQHNYFIINKGYEDGIFPESGVITSNGVVGIIDAVDKHYSYGLSLMNTNLNVSARLGIDGAIGPMKWDGISSSRALLQEISIQNEQTPGDTVWTSGFSSIFPADIPLGITGESRVINGATYEIDVDLFQDFNDLKYVTVAINSGREEILYLENLENNETEE